MNNFSSYIRLARLHSPVPIFFVLAPCLFILGASAPRDWSTMIILIKVCLGAVIARSLGCVINDMVDFNIDAQTERGKSRPIASGELTMNKALMFCGALCLLGLALLLTMRLEVIMFGLIVFLGMALYPFTKLFLPVPQIFLGLVFASGSLFCILELEGRTNMQATLIYLGCVCWVIGYDMVYAFQDIEDDKRLNLYTATRFYRDPKKTLTTLYDSTAALWALAGVVAHMGYGFIASCALAWSLFRWQVSDFDPESRDPAEFKRIFNFNTVIGVVMVIAFFLGYNPGSNPFLGSGKVMQVENRTNSKMERRAELTKTNKILEEIQSRIESSLQHELNTEDK